MPHVIVNEEILVGHKRTESTPKEVAEAIQCLRPADFSELKGLPNPPQAVKEVLACIEVALGRPHEWKDIVHDLKDPNMLRSLVAFSKDHLTKRQSKDFYRRAAQIEPDAIKCNSVACYGLAKWVKIVERVSKSANE